MKTNHYNTKSTKQMRAVESDVTLSECCEPDCKITLMIDKSEVSRKNRCLACMMKAKLRNKVSR